MSLDNLNLGSWRAPQNAGDWHDVVVFLDTKNDVRFCAEANDELPQAITNLLADLADRPWAIKTILEAQTLAEQHASSVGCQWLEWYLLRFVCELYSNVGADPVQMGPSWDSMGTGAWLVTRKGVRRWVFNSAEFRKYESKFFKANESLYSDPQQRFIDSILYGALMAQMDVWRRQLAIVEQMSVARLLASEQNEVREQ